MSSVTRDKRKYGVPSTGRQITKQPKPSEQREEDKEFYRNTDPRYDQEYGLVSGRLYPLIDDE